MSKSLKKLIDINRLREFKNKLVGTDSAYVQTGAVDQTVDGTKTFSESIVGSVTGNAATATKLATARTINGTAFNGTANITTANWGTARNISITDGTNTSTAVSVNGSANVSLNLPATIKANLTGNCSGSSGSCTGNAATATTATTAKSCTGNAATATKLATTRAINGTNFDGSTAITTANWGTARNISISDSDGTNTGTAVSVNGSGNATLKLPATIKASITGNVSGSSGSCTGNAASATITKGNKNTGSYVTSVKSGNALVNADNTQFATIYNAPTKNYRVGCATWPDNGENIVWYSITNANVSSSTNTVNKSMTWNAETGILTANGFAGPLTGNVTGNCSGSSGSCTGNAATATKLATARTIALSGGATGTATSFNGTANIAIPVTSLDASKLTGTASVSTTGNAATATTAANADHATSADSATRATSADRASVANCVQSQTSAHNRISFDWDSQVSGYVGLRVDVTDMGGIVTTNRLVSAIRAQWYAAYPDGAEAHNAMWGGRDITAAFNNGTVSEHIADGTFKDIFPGDYITKAVTIYGNGTPGMTYTVNWVIADCDYWINKGDTATTTHHVAIVPQQPIFDANMNATNTTEGGYKGSVMYRSIIRASVTGGIVSAFGSDHILTFRDGITNSVDTSHVSSGIPQWTGTPGWFGEWVSVQCNLMSEKMVFGAPVCSAGAMDNAMATRQMSAFRLSEKLINYNRQWWWLRDVVSSTEFALAGGAGHAYLNNASGVGGVRPFALLR